MLCVTVRPIVPPLLVDLSGSGSGSGSASASGDPDFSSGYMSGSGIPSGSISGSGQSGDGSGHLVRYQEGADTLMWQTSASGSSMQVRGGSGSGSGVIITSVSSGDQESGEESGLFYEQSGTRGLPSGLGSGSSGSGTSGFFSGEESSLPSGLGSGISGSGTSGFFSGEELSRSDFSGVSFKNTEMTDLTASPSGEQELSGVSPFELTDVIGFGSASGSAIGSGTIIDFASGSAIGFGSGSASGVSGYPSHPSGEVSGPIQSQDGKIVILKDDEVELMFRPTIGTEQGRGSVEISGEGSSQEHYAVDLSISLSNSTSYEDYWSVNETVDLLPERHKQLNVITEAFDVTDQSPLNTTPPTTSILITSPSAILQTPKAMEEPSVTDGNN